MLSRGSALFPIPSAFQTTGVVAATFTMVIVAMATLYTTRMLMNQAIATGQHDYETVSYAVGGFWMKVHAPLQDNRNVSTCC